MVTFYRSTETPLALVTLPTGTAGCQTTVAGAIPLPVMSAATPLHVAPVQLLRCLFRHSVFP